MHLFHLNPVSLLDLPSFVLFNQNLSIENCQRLDKAWKSSTQVESGIDVGLHNRSKYKEASAESITVETC